MNSFGYYYKVEDGENVAADPAVELDSKIASIAENAINTLKAGGAELVDMSEMLPDSLIQELRNTGYADVFEWDLNTYLASLGEDAPMKSMWDIKEDGGHMTGSINSAHDPETDPISDPREKMCIRDRMICLGGIQRKNRQGEEMVSPCLFFFTHSLVLFG